MKKLLFAGNCSHVVNWLEVIESLPAVGSQSRYKPDEWKTKPEFNTMHQLWANAGISTDVVLVDNFYPGEHYSKDVTTCMEEFLGLEEVESWISHVKPGYCIPYHWDFDPDIEPIKNRPLKRFSCRISEHKFGHIFIVEDEVMYGGAVGDLYQFPESVSWHAGANIGLENKFMYHFTGR